MVGEEMQRKPTIEGEREGSWLQPSLRSRLRILSLSYLLESSSLYRLASFSVGGVSSFPTFPVKDQGRGKVKEDNTETPTREKKETDGEGRLTPGNSSAHSVCE